MITKNKNKLKYFFRELKRLSAYNKYKKDLYDMSTFSLIDSMQLNFMLASSFQPWSDTSEGLDFWLNIYYKIRNEK
jgi:hypothetical protein